MNRLGLEDLRGIVSDADELAKGTRLYDERTLAHLARHENRVFGDAAGSGAAPYKVALTFGDGPREVKARCSCMAARSRPFCKHAAALLVAWARAPESFVESPAPPPEAAGRTVARKSVKTGPTDGAALMRDGVERVATLVRELGSSGVASLGADRVPQLRRLAEGLRESRLRRLSARVLELATLLEQAVAERSSPRPTDYTDLVADMLLTVRKLEKHLAGEPLGDRHVEELVGKTWRKTDRRPATGLDLVEYAFATSTTSDGFRICESRFLDLATGTHYSEKQILPSFLVKRTEPKRSYAARVLAGAAGSVYPGYPPLRLDLEAPGAETPLSAGAVLRLVERALPGVGAALAAFQEHRKDIFAPDLFPVAVRVELLYAGGRRVQVVDAEGNALHLPGDASLEERLAGSLRGGRLRALLGDVGLETTLPTLFPRAAVVEGARGAELWPLAGGPELAFEPRRPARRKPDREPGSGWTEVARAAGASEVAISLGEVREDLADGFVTGIASLTPRATDPLVARLADLGFEKPAALLAALARQTDPTDGIDDFVKLYQVLGIAQVRLAGLARIDHAALVAVPTYESVSVPRPTETLEPRQAAALRAAGHLNRYQAAVHVASHYESLSEEELAADIFPAWADGSVSPFIARALAPRGPAAVAIARRVLETGTREGAGRIACMTALQVLGAVGSPAAVAALTAYAQAARDPGLRVFATDVLDALRPPGSDPDARARKDRDALAERVDGAVQQLLAAPQKEGRVAAARLLAELGSLAAAPALRVAFHQDPTLDVREAAALALGRLGDAEMVDAFVRLLEARAAGEADAKMAACALGHMGDARGVQALLDAYAEGWKPAVVAEAMKSLGVVVLEPLVRLVEDRPEIAQRKAAGSVLTQLPAADVTAFLTARLEATRMAPRFAERAGLYLRLVADGEEIRKGLAERIAELLPAAGSAEEKALLRAVAKARR